jgi:hypothetical protein
MLEAISARRQQAYESQQDFSDERFQQEEAPEGSEWQEPADGRFSDRWAPEPNSWAPAREIGYRVRR